MLIKQALTGDRYIVVKIHAEKEIIKRLWQVGLTVNSQIRVEKVIPLGGVVVVTDGIRLSLSKKLLWAIEVRDV